MHLRILDIKKKIKLSIGYIQLGLSYQNFNNIINKKKQGIQFDNLKNICEILDCTLNDLFVEFYNKTNNVKF